MKKVKSLSFGKSSALVLAGVLALSNISAVSAEIKTDVINEKWGKPTLVYGGSLSDEQVNEVNGLLKVGNIENVNRQLVNAGDMISFLGTGDPNTLMISSVLVQKRDKGQGVDVEIKTPENITSVTATQYANAAITAGATDVEIDVVSPVPVTGESALTGVYKALTANGQSLDSGRTEVAQRELVTTNGIASESDLNEEQSAQLDNALAQIKTDLAKYKEENGEKASHDVVLDTVNKAIKDNGLDKYITDGQIESLVSLAEAYQNTSAIDDEEVQKQLGNLQNKMAEAYEGVKGALTSDEAKNFFQAAGDWLKSLWEGMLGWF